MLKLKLNSDLMQKINTNKLKAVELIQFIFHNIKTAKTEKQLYNTALKDIKIDNKYITACRIDTWKNELIINL